MPCWPTKSRRIHTPFILDLQNGYPDMLETFVAVPLRAEGIVGRRLGRIHSLLTVGGQSLVLDTPMMATFPHRGLGRPVYNLRQSQLEIQDALAALFGEY
ncbi:MAG: CcdB family protein [Rhodoferax sp.]|nr:CcdB family protein [Rhodoferax sp.]